MDLERETVMKILIVLVTLFVERTTAMVPVMDKATLLHKCLIFILNMKDSVREGVKKSRFFFRKKS